MPKECGNSQPVKQNTRAQQTCARLRAEHAVSGTLAVLISAISGDDGVRTRDLVVANHALSQLSYIPNGASPSGRTWIRTKDLSFIRAAL